MARKYIYGIISANRPLTFGVSGFPPSPEEVYTVVSGDLGCVVSNYSGEDFASLPKVALLRCLMAHQEVIERVMKESPILPVKFGTLVDSAVEVQRLIEQGQRRLGQALEGLAAKVEMEVAATWDLKRVLAEIGQEDEILRLKESIAGRPAAEALEQQVQAGRIVKEMLDRRRDQYQERIVARLAGQALDVQPNALVADEMVMNVAFLIEREREAEFDEQVRELDKGLNSEVTFRIVGPLPPYSFATVEVARPCPERIEEARRLLGLDAAVSEAEVKRAYRRLAAETHPDAHPEGEPADEQFAQVREAFALLADYCRGQNQPGDQASQDRRFSLAPEDVSQAFLVSVRRVAAQVV